MLKISSELEAQILQLAQTHQQSPEDFIRTLIHNGEAQQRLSNPNQKLLDDVLSFVAQGGWQQHGETFLRSLVKYLAEQLQVEYAFVDEFADETKTIARTVVFWAGSDYAENIVYALENTPCEGVLTLGLCTYPANIQQLFPLDAMLVDAGAEAYSGVPLWNSQGERIGLVAVMGKQPFPQPELINAVLQIVAVRTAHELERIQYEKELATYQQNLETLVEQRTIQLAVTNEILRGEIHERQNTEAILRTEKLQTELILNNVADAVLLADTTPAIVYVNPAWEQQTGYQQGEVVGKNPNILHSGNTPKSTYEDLWQTIADGQVWTGLMFNRRKDGSQYDALATIVPIVEPNSIIRNYVEVHRDVTEERQLNAMKEAFIANAAHDLGNPVAVLQTSLTLLKRNPAQYDKRIAIIENQADRLFALVRDLLTVSRLDRKMMIPQLAPLNLNTLVARILEAQQALADERSQTLIFTPQPDIPPVIADAEQIERVMVNLVSNALRYTITGGTIEIQIQHVYDRVAFIIKDEGIGIPADDLPFIFDRFFRSVNAQSVTHGTGLGLAIVKEIVNLHNGNITVESNLGRGTTFMVYLPIAPSC
jgi:PAS domain S-box-containing protein